ncbi:D-alanyl-D-alanine carboxypeptidase family protein [Nonomuraea ceibae]|uniref:D-alanyl-D-alanine carboxypeptidase family protein n=1 Tax=Nonomuraea ceibae TaxID=1935170 RepID=UPI002484D58E|nr:serine hydrolase [Nonomuraea ceibae]
MPTSLFSSARPRRWGRALAGAALAAGVLTTGTTAAHAATTATPATTASFAGPASYAPADAPAVLGRAALVVDTSTGEVRYSKDAGERLPVASLTKMMTAHVVLQEADPADVVEVTAEDVRYAARGGAAVAGLRAGDRLPVRDVLHALLLPSGADAAHVLARTYGPGVEGFVGKMNAAARELGMADTLYVNADGMPTNGGGHSTAADQARLAEAVLRNETLKSITSTRYHSVGATSEHGSYSWRNTNRLLARPGAVGVKTGYTRAAGYTLAFAAERDGRLLVGVILGESDSGRRFDTAQALLDWAATAGKA